MNLLIKVSYFYVPVASMVPLVAIIIQRDTVGVEEFCYHAFILDQSIHFYHENFFMLHA